MRGDDVVARAAAALVAQLRNDAEAETAEAEALKKPEEAPEMSNNKTPGVEERRRLVAEAGADLAAATTKAEAATKRARGVLGDDPAVVSGITRGSSARMDARRDNAYRAQHEQIAAAQSAEQRLAVARRQLAQAEADSAAAANFETLAPGDLVRQAGSPRWDVVRRVNAKTVSVESGYSWADLVPRDRIVETRKQPTKEQP